MESSKSTTIRTLRFGEISFTSGDLLEFPWGLPGFADLRRFVALSPADQPGLVWLQSVESPDVALPAADPYRIFPDYDPRLPQYVFETLEIRNQEDFSLLCILGLGKKTPTTMNLAAPVLVNLKMRRARQVMLDDGTYAVRTPVPEGSLERQGAVHPV
jgi:flagellar assembly factor FliW